MCIDILSKIATTIVCVVAVLGYIFTIKPTYDLKMLEKEAKNLKKEKAELNSYIDSSKEKIKKYEIDIQSKKQEIVILDKELRNIEKEHYNMILANLLEPVIEIMRAIFGSFSDKTITEEIKYMTKQPNQLIEISLKNLKEKQQKSTSQIEKQIYTKILKDYKNGLAKNKNRLKCVEPNYAEWERLQIKAKELKNDKEILNKCYIDWENRIMQSNNISKSDLERSKSLQEAKIEQCHKNIQYYIEYYFMDKTKTYTDACYEIIISTNKIIMQKYDFTKIDELNRKISNPNFDELRQYLLEKL